MLIMTSRGTMARRLHASYSRMTGSKYPSRNYLQRGFTLIELMIVVTIVSVLAVIAVVSYRKITLSAKVTEAQNVISAIRIAQEDFKVERGTYANIGTTYCPTNGLAQTKTQWNTTCNGGSATWQTLPVHIDGPVQFGYATVSGGTLPTIGWIDMTAAASAVASNRPWYVIMAQADLDGTGGLHTELVGTSFQNTIFSRYEGE
jgi:type IV pilus assembly protein PilA